jgi:hypothetical protein
MTRRRPLHEYDEEVKSSEEGGGGGYGSKEQGVLPDSSEEPYNPLSWLVLPWHLAMVVFYCLLLRQSSIVMNKEEYMSALDPTGKMPEFGGRFKFLTHINACLQLGFFTMQLVADLSPGPFRKKLQKLADVIFTTMAFPLATFVTLNFWGLYALDRNLIYPEVFDKVVPQYMNHFMHTTVFLWVLCEMYLYHHHFPSTALAAATIFVYSLAYCSWIVYLYVASGWWCYRFMRHLPSYAMVVFFACSIFLCLGLHLLGKLVARIRWGKTTYLEGY